MSQPSSSSSGGGVGFFGLLFIVFLVLQLTGVIAWSWLWVTAPLWAPLGLWLLFVVTVGIAGYILAYRKEKRRAAYHWERYRR